MKRARTPAAVLVLAGSLLLAPAASGEGQIAASPPNQYVTTEVTIAQGERVTFTNTDVAEHDVVARAAGPDGNPLFRSALVGVGGSAPVEGTEYLVTGSYAFFCSLHPHMEGKLNVSSAGTPAPRPGGGSRFEVKVLDTRIGRVKRQGALRVRVTTGGAATVQMTARAKGSAFARGSAKFSGAQTKTIRLPLTRAGRRLVRRARRIAVTVAATAKAGGETTKKSAKATLRR